MKIFNYIEYVNEMRLSDAASINIKQNKELGKNIQSELKKEFTADVPFIKHVYIHALDKSINIYYNEYDGHYFDTDILPERTSFKSISEFNSFLKGYLLKLFRYRKSYLKRDNHYYDLVFEELNIHIPVYIHDLFKDDVDIKLITILNNNIFKNDKIYL